MRSSQSVLFADTRKAKRLARETAKQNVMIGNVLRHIRHDVADDLVALSEIGRICLLRPFVPLRRENTSATSRLKSEPNSADAGEKINERKAVTARCMLRCA